MAIEITFIFKQDFYQSLVNEEVQTKRDKVVVIAVERPDANSEPEAAKNRAALKRYP